MTKQTNFLGFMLIKTLALFIVAIAFIFVYLELRSFNVPLTVSFSDYQVSTYSGVLAAGIIIFIIILFSIIGIINAIIRGFQYFGEKYRGSKINTSISYLIESSILLAFGGKKDALKKILLVDKKYLSEEQKDYADLIESMSSSETIPITLYGYIHKFPFIQNQLSKKLAQIEFKLGNLDKAFEYARQYHSYVAYDEEINLLMAKIYGEQKDWKSMDGIISSIISHEISIEGKKILANLYLEAAKASLNNPKTIDSLMYCKKALELVPDNIEAAELFAEVGISQKNYELVRMSLINAFAAKPNFQIFLILKKFSDITYEEIYQQLIECCNYQLYLDLFLSISVILELSERQQELLEQIV